MRAALVVVMVLVSACAGEVAVEMTTSTVQVESPFTASTTVVEVTTSTTLPEVVVLEPIAPLENDDGEISRKLAEGVTYQGGFDGVTVLVTPPSGGWELSSFADSGADAGLQFDWNGPSGFRAETLNVRVLDVGFGVAEAWDRIDALGDDGLARHGQAWEWVDEGTAVLGGMEVEWREARTPELPPIEVPGLEEYYLVGGGYVMGVWGNTSVRFHVLPLGGDLTVTLMAFETRCACTSRPHELFDGNQIADEVENELRDWLPELEAFLEAMEFV